MYLPSESEEHWEHKATFELLSVLLLNADSAIKSRLPFWTCSISRLFTLEESDSDGLGLKCGGGGVSGLDIGVPGLLFVLTQRGALLEFKESKLLFRNSLL